jgi:hypothetical protein
MELKPTARTEQTFKYDIPRDGDVVQSITIAASSKLLRRLASALFASRYPPGHILIFG